MRSYRINVPLESPRTWLALVVCGPGGVRLLGSCRFVVRHEGIWFAGGPADSYMQPWLHSDNQCELCYISLIIPELQSESCVRLGSAWQRGSVADMI